MDGRAVAQRILDRCAIRIQEIVARIGTRPCPATVLVGDAPSSVTYTRMKRTRSEAVGMRSRSHDLGAIVAEADLVVAAVGKARFVQSSWTKPGAVAIDAGLWRLERRRRGFRA